MHYLSPADAGATMRHARSCLKAGTISRTALATLDCLTWNCRAPGKATVKVSISLLQRLLHAARATVVDALKQLEAVGLIQRRRQRVRVSWQGGTASREATAETTITPPSTQSSPPAPSHQSKKIQKEELLSNKGDAGAIGAMLEAAARLPDFLAARRAALEASWRGFVRDPDKTLPLPRP